MSRVPCGAGGGVIKIKRTVRKPVQTTRTCNDIRIALALRRSFSPLPPPLPRSSK